MGKPDPPRPPDPQRVAQAQSAANRDAAILEARLNRVNQITPYGSVTYSEETRNGAPFFTQTVTESAAQRGLREAQEGASLALNQLATQQAGRLGNLLNEPFNPEGFQSTQVTQGPLSIDDEIGAYNASAYDPMAQAPFDLSRYNTANLGGFDLSRYDPGRTLPQLDVSRFDPSRQTGLDLTHYDPSRLDPLALAQYDPNRALPAYDNARFDPMSQPGPDLSAYNQARLGGLDLGAYDPTNRLGDFSADVEKGARELATRGLGEQFGRAEESLRTRLANQGIEAGSEAFKAELGAFNEGKGRAYAQAELAARDTARADRGAMSAELAQGAGLAAQSRADLLARMSQGAGLEQAQSADALNRLLSSYGMYNEGRAIQGSELARGAELAGLERADALNTLGRGADLASLMNQDALTRQRTGYEMYMGGRGQAFNELGRGAELAGQERADLLTRMTQGAELAGLERQDLMNALNTGFDQYNQVRAAQLAEMFGERQTNLSEAEADYRRRYELKLARRQVPLQEINSITSGAPLNPLNPGAVATANVAPSDVLGAYELASNMEMNNYNAQTAQNQQQRQRLATVGAALITAF